MEEKTTTEDSNLEVLSQTQHFQISLAANALLEITFSKLPYTRLDFLVPAFIRGYAESLYYRAPDDSYSFITAGKIFLPISLQSVLKKNPAYQLGLKNMPKAVKQLAGNIPMLLFHRTFESETVSEIWGDFSRQSFIPRMVVIQCADGIFSVTYRRIDEEAQIETDHADEEQIEELLFEKTEATGLPEPVSVSETEKDIWTRQVEDIKKHIAAGVISKAVLSRVFTKPIHSGFAITDIVKTFAGNPATHRFLYRQGNTLLAGASPEKLLSFREGTLTTEAIAGTVQRGANSENDENAEKKLLESHKERDEHQIVADFLVSTLLQYSDCVSAGDVPVPRKIAKLIHLFTPVSADGIDPEKLPEIIDSLFPTPATCGEPKKASYEIIKNIESHERGLYCGQIGWVTIDQAVESFVPLRVALLKDSTMTLFSGCGIVAESEAESELAEVIQKADSILSLFNNAN